MLGADESPRDENAEMERWRMMYEGMDFWDDVNDWKPLNWDLPVQARKLEMEFFKKMGVYKEMISDSVEPCETEVCFLHVQLTGTNE